MKHFLRKHGRFLSLQHYIAVLRKQPEHMKQVYAAAFAGCITVIIAGVILYVDYGFWHEKYRRSDVIELVDVKTVNDPMVTVVSPTAMIGGFFKEASEKVKTINFSVPDGILEGKDSYTREEER